MAFYARWAQALLHGVSAPLASALGLTIVLTASLGAQAATSFQVLEVPAGQLGTCEAPKAAAKIRLKRRKVSLSHLVMASIPPGAHRDITAFSDSTGHAVLLFDMGVDTESLLGGTGDFVIARIAPGGRVTGTLRHSVMRVIGGGVDSKGEPVLPPPIRRIQSRPRALDVARQNKVRILAEWILRRCPA